MPYTKVDPEKLKLTVPQPPKLEGRPSKMTPLLLQKLEQGFAMGLNDTEACLYAGIVPATLYNFQKVNPQFLERKRQLKANPIMKAKVTVHDDLDRVATAQWYLERRSPEFRKEETDDGTKQQFNFFISDEQLIGQLREYLGGVTTNGISRSSKEIVTGSEEEIEFDDGGEISEPGEG